MKRGLSADPHLAAAENNNSLSREERDTLAPIPALTAANDPSLLGTANKQWHSLKEAGTKKLFGAAAPSKRRTQSFVDKTGWWECPNRTVHIFRASESVNGRFWTT